VTTPSNGDAAELSALRDELRTLREELAELRALPTTAVHPPVEPPSAQEASAREAEITGLVARLEYFKNTTFDSVECRTTLCRVVTSFPNPPRTEVFLSIDGPLPR
jgi:hypothetical protein